MATKSQRRVCAALLSLTTFVLFCFHGARAEAQKPLGQGIQSLAADILAKVTREQKHRVAVLPFHEMSGRRSVLDGYLAEALLTDFVAAGNFQVIERAMLDKILGEIQLGKTGVLDSATVRHLGKVAGVDAIVSGTITELNTYLAVNCRLFDAETGQVFAASQTWIVKDSNVMALLAQPEPGAPPPPPAGGKGAGRGPSGSQPGQALAAEREQGFTFELLECRGEGSVISCDVRITNRMADRWIWLSSGYGARTYLVDSQGSSCAASKSSFTWGTLPSGVPRKVTVDFANCPRNATALSYVELGLQLDNPALGGKFKVPFRHTIPVVNR
jgi:TolB-like protein